MRIEAWLQAATADAEQRGVPELKPVLEALARATKALRAADFNDEASGGGAGGSRQSSIDGRSPSTDGQRSSGGGRS